jgi:hypothetical protein
LILQEESKFQQEQVILQKVQAGSLSTTKVKVAPPPSKPWGMKPWKNMITQ